MCSVGPNACFGPTAWIVNARAGVLGARCKSHEVRRLGAPDLKLPKKVKSIFPTLFSFSKSKSKSSLSSLSSLLLLLAANETTTTRPSGKRQTSMIDNCGPIAAMVAPAVVSLATTVSATMC